MNNLSAPDEVVLDRPSGTLLLSVIWGYAAALFLLLFIFLILVPDADGPSPWDGEAFRKAVLEMLANFRILDDLADLNVVKIADVGDGFLVADLDLLHVSNRKFGWTPFNIAVGSILCALLVRSLRFRLLARHFGIPSDASGQVSGFFYGRGVHLLFPYGAGELGSVRALLAGGASEGAAQGTVFHNRLFEILAINTFLLIAFVYLGWEGGLAPLLWSLVILAAVVSFTRPLGSIGDERGRRGVIGRIWTVLYGRYVLNTIADLLRTPRSTVGIWLLSCLAVALEIAGLWCIKQAFSSPLDDYVLMKNLPLLHFAIVACVAGLAKIVPYTFASLGVYELVTVLMFRVFGEGYLGGTTVALLESMLLNGMTLVLFLLTMLLTRCPSVVETWTQFFQLSAEAVPEP